MGGNSPGGGNGGPPFDGGCISFGLLFLPVVLVGLLLSPFSQREIGTVAFAPQDEFAVDSIPLDPFRDAGGSSFTEIPVVDIGPLRSYLSKLRSSNARSNSFDSDDGDAERVAAIARTLDAACRDVGFFYIINHGVNSSLRSTMENLSRTFFALSQNEKEKIRMMNGGRAWRGYFPPGGELTSGKPDRKEGLYFGVELPPSDERVISNVPMHGPNLWPPQPGLEQFNSTILSYMEEVSQVAQDVLYGMALGLGIPGHYFSDRFTHEPTLLFRIFNYEKHRWGDHLDEYGVREHTDYGFLTILLQDDSGGLQVQNRNGVWVDAPPMKDSFVVNIGDMLEVWTHGQYRATPHRVRNKGDGDRISFPLFFDPAWNATMEPIDESILPPLDASNRFHPRWDGVDLQHLPSITYGEYLWAKVSRCFPKLAALSVHQAMRSVEAEE